MRNNYSVSDEGIKMLVDFEGEILKVYKDPVGLPTFGVGHLVKPHETAEFPVGKKITRATSRAYLKQDLAEFEACVNDLVKVPITQNQFDALVSLAFNIGPANFKRSSVLRHLNNRQFTKAANAFLAWNKARKNGKLIVLDGLVRRRNTERSVFLTPDPQDSAADAPTNNPQTIEQATDDTTQAAPDTPPPTLWERVTGWVDTISAKFTKVQEVGDKLSPISGSSKFAIVSTKAGGWAMLILGFFVDHWLWIVGVVLIVVGVWYFSRSKDRAQARS